MQNKPSKFNTINWRMPFSYAVIALITAITLGSVMLLVLNSYYTNLEKNYLKTNANYLQPIIESLLASRISQSQLNDQLTVIAFLSQTQLQIVDQQSTIVADSGPIQSMKRIAIKNDANGNAFFGMVYDPSSISSTVSSYIITENNPSADSSSTQTGQGPKSVVISVSSAPMGGFWVSSEMLADDSKHSPQVLIQPLLNGTYNLELSNGPAYGSDVLESVSLAWGLAAIFSCIVAIISGAMLSRQVTRPVLHLTDATRNMEKGQLSTRVALGEGKMNEFIQLANSFNTMAERIEKTVSTLRSFVSDAAHEINTPLTALKINLELAQNEPTLEKKEHYIDLAYQNSQRLEQLSGSLLNLSRIESNHVLPETNDIALGSFLQRLCEPYASRAEQKEIDFLMNLPNEPVIIEGDEQQMSQAVSNLLENALKFTPQQGLIQVNLAAEENMAVLQICDNGIGIPEEDMPHLFERFHRGRNTNSYPGNGLGLAIVKAIITAHRGTVKAIALSQGSCFQIELPLKI